MALVEARPLSGFQDVLPADALVFERAVERLKEVFRRYGFAPIDTPCIYRYETLTGGRAGIDKQLFEWHKKDDRGREGEHVALRFDLTVPLARYVAANAGQLTFPFKRYDIGKVWRGERAQKGRYREFYQCDFDLVGTTAAGADLEVALVMADAVEAVGAERFQVRLNDRQILNGLLQGLGLLERSEEVLRVIDKLDKIDEAGVVDELTRPPAPSPAPSGGGGGGQGIGLSPEAARSVLDFVRLSREETGTALLAALQARFHDNPLAAEGVGRLRFVVEGAQRLRGTERFAVDLSIARGLGYYTGTVYETMLLDAPEFGSVCSGGRYDDLASYYTKQRLPGVGASVGLSRLLAALAQTRPDARSAAPAPVVVVTAPELGALAGVRIADLLRRAGVGAEAYPQAAGGEAEGAARIGRQMKYADERGATLVVIVHPEEQGRGAVALRDLRSRTQEEVAEAHLGERVQALLAGNP